MPNAHACIYLPKAVHANVVKGTDPAMEEMLRDAKEQSSQAEKALLEIKVRYTWYLV